MTAKIESCAACQQYGCHFNLGKKADKHCVRKAFLVDEIWPEFAAYITDHAAPEDIFIAPLNGRAFKKPRYEWPVDHFRRPRFLTFTAFRRAYDLRFRHDRPPGEIFSKYSGLLYARARRAIPYDAEHFVLYADFAAPAFISGDLGGRTYDVLMTRYPYKILQAKLDAAMLTHPHSRTLNDFRVSDSIVEAEWQALQFADKIITPHVDVARLFPDKAVLLPWKIPGPPRQSGGARVAFFGPVVARKGAYEVREIARVLPQPLVVFGKTLESDDFWNGVIIERRVYSDAALKDVGVIVNPSYVESRPGYLLDAYARGIEIYATASAGLGSSMIRDMADFMRR
jgi:hypothetical protein